MRSMDESAITEITIGTDGQIYVFGLSREILEVLSGLCPNDPAIQQRIERLSVLASDAAGRRSAESTGETETASSSSDID
jgi:hypothetical protein